MLCPLPFIRRALGYVAAGAAAAQRDATQNSSVVAYVPFALRARAREARDLLRPEIAFNLARFAGKTNLERLLTQDGLLDASRMQWIARRVGEGAAPSEVIDDDLVDALCLAGDEDDVRRRLDAYGKAGVREIALFGVGTDAQSREMLKTLARITAETADRDARAAMATRHDRRGRKGIARCRPIKPSPCSTVAPRPTTRRCWPCTTGFSPPTTRSTPGCSRKAGTTTRAGRSSTRTATPIRASTTGCWCGTTTARASRLIKPYGAGNIRIVVRGDMAMVAADGVSRTKEWVRRPEDVHNPKRYRTTQVCVRKDGRWQVVHAHFSEQTEGLRPDQQG